MDHDARDQRPRGIDGLGVITGGDGVPEPAQGRTIGIPQVGHQTDNCWFGRGPGLGEALPLGLKGRQLRLKAWATQSFGDCVNQMGQLAFHSSHLAPQTCLHAPGFSRETIPLGGELYGEDFGEIWVHQLLGQNIQYDLVQLLPVHGGTIGAEVKIGLAAGIGFPPQG